MKLRSTIGTVSLQDTEYGTDPSRLCSWNLKPIIMAFVLLASEVSSSLDVVNEFRRVESLHS